ERCHRWRIDYSGDKQSGVLLISRNRLTRCRSEGAGECPAVIAFFLKRALHIQDHLVRQQIAVGINRPVIIVVFVYRIVTPRREPITPVPIIISASDKNDDREMLFPPNAIVPLMPISLKCIRITEPHIVDWRTVGR